MPSYAISGRVVGANGASIENITVTVFEIPSLMGSLQTKGSALTGSDGKYNIVWAEVASPAFPWDLFVRATDGTTTVDSPLISDLESTASADIVLSDSPYTGRSEWERISAKLSAPLSTTAPKDVPVDRIEWLSRRADVFPTHLGSYIQAHRLADQRTVKAETCYAMLRAGLPASLPELLRVGERAWEGALRNAWLRRILPLPGDGSASALDAEVATEILAMRELVVAAAITVPTGGATTQRVLFDTAGLSQVDQTTFMQTWVARTGTLAQFWSDLTTALSNDTAKVETFQFTIQAATLAGNNVSLLTKLQTERGQSISTVRDLAAWSVSDWDSFLDVRGVDLPADVPGGDATAQRQNTREPSTASSRTVILPTRCATPSRSTRQRRASPRTPLMS